MKIYIISGSHGDYSDRTQWDVIATYTEEKAKEIVSKLEELTKHKKAFSEELYKFDKIYAINNPTPIHLNKYINDHLPAPKRPKGIAESTLRKAQQSLLAPKASVVAAAEKTIAEYNLYKPAMDKYSQDMKQWEQACETYRKELDAFERLKETARKEWIEDNYSLPEHLKEVSLLEEYPYEDAEYTYFEIEVI